VTLRLSTTLITVTATCLTPDGINRRHSIQQHQAAAGQVGATDFIFNLNLYL